MSYRSLLRTYSRTNQVCGDPEQFQVLCTGCEFSGLHNQPRCQLRGCLGSALNVTEDGLANVTYSSDGVILTSAIENGDYVVGESVKVECPVGYRVPTTDVSITIKKETRQTASSTSQVIGIAYEYQNLETQGPSLPTKEAVVQEGTVFTTTTTTTRERDGPTSATDVRFAMSTCTSEVIVT
jgi:hypothetical protein